MSAFGNLLVMGNDLEDENFVNYFRIKNEYIIEAIHTVYNKILDKFTYFEIRI